MHSTKPQILFEDTDILVLDKPSGWIVNEASTTTNQPVVQKWLYENFAFSRKLPKECRGGIVHRLDKETSGVLVVAKSVESFFAIQNLFKERKIKKTYIALVHGEPNDPEGEVTAPVGRLPWRRDRFGVLPGGRNAYTAYKTTKTYEDGRQNIYSLLELNPKTGRTHQIRIHLKHIGNPIVADSFYAGRKTARNDRRIFPRMFLHASKLEFKFLKNNKTYAFESKVPQDLAAPLKNFKKIVR